VDEGILQVAGYKSPTRSAIFFQKRALQVQTAQILDLILPNSKLLRSRAATGGDEGMNAIGKISTPSSASGTSGGLLVGNPQCGSTRAR